MEKEQFEQILQHTKEELQAMHTGRANPALIEEVKVQAYGSTMTVQELGSILVPEPQQLLIQPWDKTVIKDIEKALRESDLHLNPVVDSDSIRITFPQLTEEKRKELVKFMHEKIEEARIAVRKVREQLLKDMKAQEKAGEISEDEFFRQEKGVQQIVDAYNTKLEELSSTKEKELMTV